MSRRRRNKLKLRTETLHSIVAVFLILCGVLVMISFSGQGVILATINEWLATYFGFSALLFPFVFIAAGLVMFQAKWAWTKPHVLLGAMLVTLSVMGLFRTGSVGQGIFQNLARLLTSYGSWAVYAGIGVSGLLILLQLSLAEVVEFSGRFAPTPKFKPPLSEDELLRQDQNDNKGFQINKLPLFNKSDAQFAINANDSVKSKVAAADMQSLPIVEKKKETKEPLDRNLLANKQLPEDDTGSVTTSQLEMPMVWEYPPLTLLSEKMGGEADRGDVKNNASIIERTLNSFGIKARVVEVNYGPAVTQYALEIALGTKLSRITSLATDLALALAAPTGQIRIEAPIAGKSMVGIEVPNQSAQFVTLRAMLQSEQMKKIKSKLAVALGLNVAGESVIADIGRMPHALIAGATGSGKSVAINAFICSILFRASPSEVKFILVDPKRVELTGYNDIPHLLTPVIVEPSKVVSALKWATHEMDNRYKQLAEVGVKNLEGYNELAGFQALPNIVIIIDELADIMLFAPSEVEESITRIAQMARAVGIHLILATQRPSVDVITGLIKANVPTRIAFNVSSMMDSRVILDSPGAEKLLGRGDLLYIPPEQAKPSRIQGTFVSETEIRRLVDFVKSQGQKPAYEEEITTKYQTNTIKGGYGGSSNHGGDGDNKDSLFDETVKLFSQYDKASSSLIQRRLSVGYARAARILDQLYEHGLVGPADGSKPRDVNLQKVREYLTQPSH